MRSCVGSRRLALSGKDVTLRTYTLGAADANYHIDAETPVTVTIKAIWSLPKVGQRTRSNASGDELLIDAVFQVADVDAPSFTAGVNAPEIDADSVTYQVTTIGPEKGGRRTLLCREMRV